MVSLICDNDNLDRHLGFEIFFLKEKFLLKLSSQQFV